MVITLEELVLNIVQLVLIHLQYVVPELLQYYGRGMSVHDAHSINYTADQLRTLLGDFALQP